MNYLLTGKPGTGKTTIIKKVIERIKDAGGFYTEEMREGGKRVGFKIVTLEGEEGILAHEKEKGEYRVGKYVVCIDDLENVAVKSIKKALRQNKIVVIDEIGKMELFSEKFREAVLFALNSEKKVLGTIMYKRNPFSDEIKKRKDTEIVVVNMKNRDEIPERLIRLILQQDPLSQPQRFSQPRDT
ncbi:MAG: NTPase [Candidatus Syntropharchaeia archaeon]